MRALTMRRFIERPVLLLAAFTLVFSLAMITSGDKVGIGDWQYYTFLWETSKHTLVDYHQLPLWNPYELGGNIYLAHPNTHFLSPLHLLLLPLDTAIALKLLVMVHIFLALWGTFVVATRIYQTPPAAALVAAVLFACSGFFGWHMQGQLEKVGLYLLPWVFYCFVRSEEKRHYAIYTALILTAIILEGGAAYPFAFIVLFLAVYATYRFFAARCDFDRLAPFALTMTLVFCFAAVRLLPIFDFLRHHPRVIAADDRIGASLLFDIYFGRRTMPNWRWPQGSYIYGWWGEYGNYLGIPFFLLFAAAAVTRFRDHKPLLTLCAVFFAISLGMHGAFSPYALLHRLPLFRGLRAPTRLNVLLFFPLALIVGQFVGSVAKALPRRALAIGFGIFVGGAALDYAYFNQTMWYGAFESPPLSSFPRRNGPFRQVPSDGRYTYQGPRMSFGALAFYEEMSVKTSAALRPYLPSEVYLEQPDAGRVALKRWTPNRLQIEVDAPATPLVLVNMNYDEHWKATGARVVNHGDLIGLVPNQPGHSTIELYYRPASFIAGSAISLVSLAAALAFLRWRRR